MPSGSLPPGEGGLGWGEDTAADSPPPQPSPTRGEGIQKGSLLMREAVVVASSRTPLAKSFRGSFNRTRPDEMAAHCLRHVLAKVPQLTAAEIEDVILGCGYPQGPQGMNVARIAAVRAGLPVTVAATTVNRFC